MRQHLPPWMKALTAQQGSPEADFDWGEWAADVFRQMRSSWTSYFLVAGLAMATFSCADAQFDPHLQNGAAAAEAKKHDPWALDKPAESKP